MCTMPSSTPACKSKHPSATPDALSLRDHDCLAIRESNELDASVELEIDPVDRAVVHQEERAMHDVVDCRQAAPRCARLECVHCLTRAGGHTRLPAGHA